MFRNHITRTFPIVQIAGIRDLEEARLLAAHGCTHLGFPMGPGVVEEDLPPFRAERVVQALHREFGSHAPCCVAITYLSEPKDILRLLDAAGMRAVQLHGRIAVTQAARLRRERPELLIFKSLVVGRDQDVLAQARAFAPHVDAFLTDTHNPETGADGATGLVHDWDVSRALVRSGLRPVILAGGLGPENVVQAVRTVRPAGVDAHTGLEDAEGKKDAQKVRTFCRRALRLLPNAAE